MVNNFLKQEFFQNSVLDYITALLLFILGIFIVKFVKNIVLKRLKTWAEQTNTTVDNFLIHIFEKTILPLFYLGALYLSVHILILPQRVNKGINILGIILVSIFGIWFLTELISYLFKSYLVGREKDATKERSLKGILVITRVVIWGLGIVFLLDNLGVKISTVIAGLGIGGIAIALASQTILGDLFSYFSILLDRPFEIGDFIIIGEYLGTVERIGIKTTHIRSLWGEDLVFSNSDLTNSRVKNYRRMEKRRVVFKLGVVYQTPAHKLKEIPNTIKNIIDSIKDTQFDRAHFSDYGDFNLIFEVVYYVLNRDYNKYMDTQQAINLAIKEEFEKLEVEFAYPTQTLFLEKINQQAEKQAL